MKRRPFLALRSAAARLPMLLGPLLGLSLSSCEIQIARSSPDSDQPRLLDQAGPGGWNDPGPRPPGYTDPGSDVPRAEPWLEHRDLIAIDPELVQGPLASNGESGALSFRSQMEWLADSSRDPLSFVRSWLEQWVTASSAQPELPPVAARPRARPVLIDSWLGLGGVGGADAGADADYLPRFTPSWADAPFALIAIVNRVDLAADPCDGFAGELRYVYSALDSRGEPLDMTIIVEIPYPTLRPAAEWASEWRRIGRLPPDASYASAVEALAREVRAEADPLRVRVRTNEVALDDSAAPAWEMREFQTMVLGGQLALAQVPLESTPRADADPGALAAHVIEHADDILEGPVPLPMELRAGAAQIPTPEFSWNVLGVSDRLRRAFSVETCNGCHGGDTRALPFRHIAPGRAANSRAELSRFLYDPAAPNDELRRRSQVLGELESSACAPREPQAPYAGP